MKYIIGLILLTAFAMNLSAQREEGEYPFKGKYSFSGSDCYLNADIELDDINLETGKQYSVGYTINADTFCRLYNPFFNSLISPPGQLALYDEDKKYISNLTRKLGGSSARVSKGYWVDVVGGSSIKKQKIFALRKNFVDNPDNLHPDNLHLEEGNYYIQAIFYKGLLSSPPDFLDPELDLSNFYESFSTEEIFRSNAIKINVVIVK